ncbi:MAG: alpha/beta hydrolase [Planctomycetales bacterium]|nr:alpha/beta hydrolase [Planctomycetales bacterium]
MIHRISLIAPSGNTISLTAAGAGSALVFLHGFPLTSELWKDQITPLSEHFQVLVPDLRGFGSSDNPYGQFSLSDLAADVECVRQHLAPDKGLHLCGLSMGGYVAFEYWRQYPQHLKSLILTNTKPGGDSAAAVAARQNMAARVTIDGTAAAVADMPLRLLADSSRECLISQVQKMMYSVPAETIAHAQLAMIDRLDFSPLLEKIKTPTFVVAGEHDLLCPPNESEAWANQIPKARFACVPGTGHLTPLEAPSEFNRRLIEFLNTI